MSCSVLQSDSYDYQVLWDATTDTDISINGVTRGATTDVGPYEYVP